jgi:hypothetical protein
MNTRQRQVISASVESINATSRLHNALYTYQVNLLISLSLPLVCSSPQSIDMRVHVHAQRAQ